MTDTKLPEVVTISNAAYKRLFETVRWYDLKPGFLNDDVLPASFFENIAGYKSEQISQKIHDMVDKAGYFVNDFEIVNCQLVMIVGPQDGGPDVRIKILTN